MSWFASIFVALPTAALGASTAGCAANLAVSWYHVSSREGGDSTLVAAIGERFNAVLATGKYDSLIGH
ncbi:MAG: hypothetical protein ABI742_14480 [Gemmatimonadota bacterium]